MKRSSETIFMENKYLQTNKIKGYNMLLYFTGSIITYEPDQEFIEDFWNNDILKKLPVSSSNPNFILAASQLRESCNFNNDPLELLHEDFVWLFSENKTLSTKPFESEFTKVQETNHNSQKQEVKTFYTTYGWKSDLSDEINDDHLGKEILFLTCMLEKYLSLEDYFCCIEMRNEIRRFIKTHLLSWVPEWNKNIQKCSHTCCYKGVGTLIQACCEDIYELLEK